MKKQSKTRYLSSPINKERNIALGRSDIENPHRTVFFFQNRRAARTPSRIRQQHYLKHNHDTHHYCYLFGRGVVMKELSTILLQTSTGAGRSVKNRTRKLLRGGNQELPGLSFTGNLTHPITRVKSVCIRRSRYIGRAARQLVFKYDTDTSAGTYFTRLRDCT